jgi:hypothetical protein
VIAVLCYFLCGDLNIRYILNYTFTPRHPLALGVEIYCLEPIRRLPKTFDRIGALGHFGVIQLLSFASQLLAIS